MKLITFVLSIQIFLTTPVLAHNEDKYGPNKGFIRMPGTFHTELVPQMDGTFVVFLLDLQNSNPTIKESSIELKIKDSKNVVTFKCKPMEDHFYCSNDKKIKIEPDSKIVLKAKRLGVKGQEIDYKLPLSLTSVK